MSGAKALLPSSDELFSFLSAAHDDVGFAGSIEELIEIERVKRLAEEEQDVVRHVDDVVDGALADGGKALDHHRAKGRPCSRG